MIARVWTARAERDRAQEYVDYFIQRVVPELRAIDGYQGAEVLTRGRAQQVEIVVMTRWASLEAVRAFAGDTYDKAVVHAAAAALLTDYDRDVKHYDIRFDGVETARLGSS